MKKHDVMHENQDRWLSESLGPVLLMGVFSWIVLFAIVYAVA